MILNASWKWGTYLKVDLHSHLEYTKQIISILKPGVNFVLYYGGYIIKKKPDNISKQFCHHVGHESCN